MKNFFLFLALIISGVAFGQYPISQNLGSDSTLVLSKGALKSRVINTVFLDTNSANIQRIKYYAGAQIYTTSDNYFWLRNSTATKWLKQASITDLITISGGCNSLVDGGIVTYAGSGLIFDVSPASYFINCNGIYNSGQSQVTLSVAHGTYDRVDVVAADTAGNVVVITGTPAAEPIKPQVNPLTQIELTHIDVPANATTPTIETLIIYDENAEWTTSSSGGTVNFNNSSFPYHGAKAIGATFISEGVYFNFSYGSVDLNLSNYSALKLYIRTEGSTADYGALNLYWANSSGVLVGNTVIVTNGTYGFSSGNDGTYMTVTVPISDFNTGSSAITSLYISFPSDAFPQCYVDYIQLQGGIATNSSPYITSIYRKTGTDSVFQVINSVPVYAFKDSIGTGSGSTYTFTNGITESGGTVEADTSVVSTIYALADTANNIRALINPGWGLTGNAGTTAGTNFIGTTDNNDFVIKRNSTEVGRFKSNYSVQLGNSTASNGYSTAIGNSIASGEGSTAMGNSIASGYSSTAMGEVTSSGSYSTASGVQTKSKSYGGFATGTYNDSTNAADEVNYNTSNRAFQIGIGTANNDRRNAMTVLFNGNTGIGTITPDSTLHVVGGLKLVNGTQGAGKVLTSDANGGASWQTAGGNVPLSSITAATQTNSFDNGDYRQEWVWNSLAGSDGLSISATTTAAASNSQRLMEINLDGVNATPNEMTTSLSVQNGHSGTSSTNIALYARSLSGTKNYAIIVPSGGGNVGIGTTTPDSTLHIVGGIKLVNGTQGAGKVLTSDANGGATWQTPSGGGGLTIGTTTIGNSVSGSVLYDSSGILSRNDNFYWNRTDKKLGIGTNSPLVKADINGSTVYRNMNVSMILRGNVTASALVFEPTDASAGSSIESINGELIFYTKSSSGNFSNANTRLTIKSTGGIIINDNGEDADTRIEGDTDPNLLFVDASADKVGIGTSSPHSKLQVAGSFSTQYTTTATGITLDATHCIVNVTATGQTITLPAASGITGRQYTIKLTASGSCTVDGNASETIDGSATYSLSAQYKYVTVVSDGTNWIITANN